jgi:hypothetical protein
MNFVRKELLLKITNPYANVIKVEIVLYCYEFCENVIKVEIVLYCYEFCLDVFVHFNKNYKSSNFYLIFIK